MSFCFQGILTAKKLIEFHRKTHRTPDDHSDIAQFLSQIDSSDSTRPLLAKKSQAAFDVSEAIQGKCRNLQQLSL